MSIRRMMSIVAAVALVLGGSAVVGRFERRAVHYHKAGAHHQRIERECAEVADHWNRMATDPVIESQLPTALVEAGLWSRDLVREADDLLHSRTSARWNQLMSIARPLALKQAEVYRRRADYHAQQKRRYERVAFSPWLSVGPEPTAPRGH